MKMKRDFTFILFHLTMLLIRQTISCRKVERLMNNKYERMRKEAIVA
jgi:hypothetical protein